VFVCLFVYLFRYYVADSFESATKKMREFSATLDRQFQVRYNPYTQRIETIETAEELRDLALTIKGDISMLCHVLDHKAGYKHWGEDAAADDDDCGPLLTALMTVILGVGVIPDYDSLSQSSARSHSQPLLLLLMMMMSDQTVLIFHRARDVAVGTAQWSASLIPWLGANICCCVRANTKGL
jgi:hypothetical protein